MERIFGKSIETHKKQGKLTHKQKIIVLEYFGILTLLKSCPQEQQKANIISAITREDFDNVKKALAFNTRFVEKGSRETKTKKNLEVVRDFFKENGLPEIAKKIQVDIDKI